MLTIPVIPGAYIVQCPTEPCENGMLASFVAGLFALKLLSRFLVQGRWSYFGFYCLAASALIFILAGTGL